MTTPKTRKVRVYISGPMTGIKDFNTPRFNEVAEQLESLGYLTLNPAMIPIGLDYEHYMDIDMAILRAADCVVTLERWRGSKGARAELAMANALQKPVYELKDFIENSVEHVNVFKGGELECRWCKDHVGTAGQCEACGK